MKNPIVVFGGAFNPPTNAHFGLAEQILNDYEVEKLFFMPVGDHYQKHGLLPATVRVEMLRETCKQQEGYEVSTIEVDSEKQLPTIETLELLRIQYPNQDIWFVMGTDNLRDLPNWDRYEDILRNFSLLILERGEDNASDIVQKHKVMRMYESKILVMNEEVRSTCSSTVVRNRLKDGKRVSFLIPEAVNRYITKHKLYM